MKLFIVGNGFDIAHGMKTSYKDFREFLKTTEKGRYLLNLYPVDDEIWSDFESNICMLNDLQDYLAESRAVSLGLGYMIVGKDKVGKYVDEAKEEMKKDGKADKR